MADRTTDGASSGAVDLAARDGNPWEGVFSEAKSFGDTFTGPPGTDGDPAPATPQPATEPLRTGTNPEPAPPAAAGDDGQAVPVPSTPPAESDPAKAADEPDPLANAEPVTYTVDGEAKTIDEFYRIPGEGIYIPEHRVPHFELIASRAESLERQNRALYEKAQADERLTAWTFKNREGQDVTVTGKDAVMIRDAEYGKAMAVATTLGAVLRDDQDLTSMLVQTEDGRVIFAPHAIEALKRQASLGEREAVLNVRTKYDRLASAPPPPVPALSAAEIQERALPTVKAVISQAKVAGLTAEDEQALVRLLPRYTITVTPQNAQQYPNARIGETVLDYPAFLPEVQDRAQLRAAAVKASATASGVDKFNKGMQQGANAGKAPVRAPAPPAQPASRGTTSTKRDGAKANEIWTNLVSEAQSVSL